MLYRYIVLTCIKRLQNDRSISAVYYLLQGKQSIQTIQDAHLFNLSQYYRIYKTLTKERFMDTVKQLEYDNYVIKHSDDSKRYITDQAEQWLEKNKVMETTWHGNGMMYYRMDDTFHQRLLLLVQVLTNAKRRERSYIPIIDKQDVKHWVKQYFIATKTNINVQLQHLYEELSNIFMNIEPVHVEMFVLQLTGHQRIGLANVQLAKHYNMNEEDVALIITSVVHRILEVVKYYPNEYVVLQQLINDLLQPTPLTESASKTSALLQKSISLEQIATQRQLKINTIYDHIVEIAIARADFPWQQYVSEDVYKKIMIAIQQTNSFTLKDIKALVPEYVSYFQIRLVLAKYHTFLS